MFSEPYCGRNCRTPGRIVEHAGVVWHWVGDTDPMTRIPRVGFRSELGVSNPVPPRPSLGPQYPTLQHQVRPESLFQRFYQGCSKAYCYCQSPNVRVIVTGIASRVGPDLTLPPNTSCLDRDAWVCSWPLIPTAVFGQQRRPQRAIIKAFLSHECVTDFRSARHRSTLLDISFPAPVPNVGRIAGDEQNIEMIPWSFWPSCESLVIIVL